MNSNAISFLVNGELRHLDFRDTGHYSPVTSLLKYLRGYEDCKSVKEGCGIGDCGACTIVIGEPVPGGKIVYKAVNACLVLLPMVHGCQVITAEHLENEGKLHPVQQALVESYGSQCGYCTPGMVMSMFALYKEGHNNRDSIQEALQGNLCRCTGYASIEEAAEKSMQNTGKDQFTAGEENISVQLEKIRTCRDIIELTHGGKKYFKVFTLSDALMIKDQFNDAVVISGSTDASLEYHESGFPDVILDIAGIPELRFIRQKGEAMIIGCTTLVQDIMRFESTNLPGLYEMASVFASKQIRNLATIGGNIITASPIGDLIPVMLAIKGRVTLQSKSGQRDMPVEEFIEGYRKTKINKDELLVSISIPDYKPEEVFVRSYKVSKRNDVDISSVSACFSIKRDSMGNVKEVILAYGGLDDHARRAFAAEKFLTTNQWNIDNVRKAINIIHEEFQPISDHRSSAKARKIAAGNLLMSFYNESTP